MVSRKKIACTRSGLCLVTVFTILFPADRLVSHGRAGDWRTRSAAVTRGDSTERSYTDQIREWHGRRVAGLKRERGWLSLVALDWLREGNNEIHSVGTVILKGGIVSVQMAAGVRARMSGSPFSSGALKTDAEQGGPDTVEIGSRAFIVIKRGDRYAVRMWDSRATARKQFAGVDCFPISRAWRITARWEAYDVPKRIKVGSVIPGYVEDYPVPGAAVFTVAGKEYRLEPVIESGASELFFIFGDRTNGKETYGSGRFLYTDFAKDGKVVLDFNKAINPPCAFTSFATCPLPPKSNKLDLRIEAGEKKPRVH
jgi:uncharacterized protein (DUF1684 family)